MPSNPSTSIHGSSLHLLMIFVISLLRVLISLFFFFRIVISNRIQDNKKIKNQLKYNYQYGVPMKDFRLAIVAVICADTPKSAILKKQKTNKEK